MDEHADQLQRDYERLRGNLLFPPVPNNNKLYMIDESERLEQQARVADEEANR